jgi:hypothetical protein
VYCFPTESELPAIIPRNAIYDSDDEDSVDNVTPLSTDEEEMEVVGHHPKYHYWRNEKYDLDIVISKANTEEKEVWSEEVNCCEIKNDTDCSYWDKLTMLRLIWVTMMGVVWGFDASAYGALI